MSRITGSKSCYCCWITEWSVIMHVWNILFWSPVCTIVFLNSLPKIIYKYLIFIVHSWAHFSSFQIQSLCSILLHSPSFTLATRNLGVIFDSTFLFTPCMQPFINWHNLYILIIFQIVLVLCISNMAVTAEPPSLS